VTINLRPWYQTYRWISAGEIFFGVNCIEEQLSKKIKHFQAKQILIITDKGVRNAGLLDKVLKLLEAIDVNLEVFDDVEPEPSLETAEKLKEIVRKGKFDLIIGIGGGSVLDISKLTALMATNPGDVKDYIGMYLIKNKGLPKILIPTTAGTGSEVSEAIVLKGALPGTKAVIYSEYAPGDVVFLDPVMTVTLPPKLTAATGMDALSHAIESYMSIDSTPFSEAFSEKAIQLIASNLRKAVYQGENLIARYNMLLASTLATMAWTQSSVCQGHAIGLAIGTQYGLPHGVSVSLALPYVMLFNLPAIPERIARIAELMGEEVKGMSPKEAGIKAIKAVINLQKDIDLPTTLLEIPNARREDIPALVDGAYKAQRLLKHSPRLTTKEDLEKIISLMFKGLDI